MFTRIGSLPLWTSVPGIARNTDGGDTPDGNQYHGYATEEDLLGSDYDSPAPEPTELEPTTPDNVQDPQAPPVQPPQTDDQRVGDAFAAQRSYYQQQLDAQLEQNRLMQQNLQLLQQQMAQFQQPQQVQEPEIPDPVEDPRGFARWSIEQAEKNLMAKIGPQFQQVQQNQYLTSYEHSLSRAQSRYGEGWEEVFNAAGRFAANRPSLQQEVFNAPDPGEAIWRLGCEVLGRNPGSPAVPQTAAPVQPGQNPATPQQPMDVETIKRQAVAEFLAQQNQNPYNRATPSVSGLPAQVVSTTSQIKPGSTEEETLLGS